MPWVWKNDALMIKDNKKCNKSLPQEEVINWRNQSSFSISALVGMFCLLKSNRFVKRWGQKMEKNITQRDLNHPDSVQEMCCWTGRMWSCAKLSFFLATKIEKKGAAPLLPSYQSSNQLFRKHCFLLKWQTGAHTNAALSQHHVVDSLLLMALRDTRGEGKKISGELTLVLLTGISSFCAYDTFSLICRCNFLFGAQWQWALNATAIKTSHWFSCWFNPVAPMANNLFPLLLITKQMRHKNLSPYTVHTSRPGC